MIQGRTFPSKFVNNSLEVLLLEGKAFYTVILKHSQPEPPGLHHSQSYLHRWPEFPCPTGYLTAVKCHEELPKKQSANVMVRRNTRQTIKGFLRRADAVLFT